VSEHRLRPYQQRAIDQLYTWFADPENEGGNPCLVLPTGSGKSHIVAALCKDALQNWPETRILMITHVKELIQQNAAKMREAWPNAPLGIYSAGLGRRDLGEPITFAGIQSVRKRAEQIGHVDLVIIDEAHLVGHRDEGGYRDFIADLTKTNPALRVVGLTATPYRLGHGLITDAPAIFHDLIEPVSIASLVKNGYLATLQSKNTRAHLDVSGVAIKQGEYSAHELQEAVDTDANNRAVVAETIQIAGERRSWLFFCSGVEHAKNIDLILRESGIASACVVGTTPKKERAEMIDDFKTGKLRALVSMGVLTTGFDAPNTDVIAMLRPTMSAGLYVQMAGRGMRIKAQGGNCLVLDFAGVVAAHGPITEVQPPKRGGKKTGVVPMRVCDECGEICAISAVVCMACGAPFPAPEATMLALRDDDIMGGDGSSMPVSSWAWNVHESATSGRSMLRATYYGRLTDAPVSEYFVVNHGGYAGEKARRNLVQIARCAGLTRFPDYDDLSDIAGLLNGTARPSEITYRKDGRFYRVTNREWTT